MRHVRIEETDAGQDSFLDVVANVVGVLIILIMLIGARASQGLLEMEQNANAAREGVQPASFDWLESSAKLVRMERQTLRSERIVQETAAQAYNVVLATAEQEQLRMELANHRVIMEEDIRRRRNLLDEQSQREFDTQRQLLEAQLKLEELTKQQISLLSEPGEVEQIEVIPTPVASRAGESPIHLRIMGGRVCFVPIDELHKEAQDEIDYIKRAIASNDRTKLVFGPKEGFRLRMVMVERSQSGPNTGPRAGFISSQKTEIYPVFQLLPESEDLGENVEQVLLPESNFLRRMKDLRKENDVVSVWLYKDSFDQFRPLKKVLYEMGYRFDVKMVPMNTLMGISRHGRRSFVQ